MNDNDRPSVPNKNLRLALWPEESPDRDRIINQLMYLPKNYEQIKKSQNLKKILLYFGSKNLNTTNGQHKFLDHNCPVNTCNITDNKSEASVVDAIIFENKIELLQHKRNMNQVWILYILESPLNTEWIRKYNFDVINWTATYRHDSDIVTPYEKFVSYNNSSLKSSNKVSQICLLKYLII